jgi:hypothetical protein
MMQLRLEFVSRHRVEIPVTYATWRDADGRHERIVYAHCVDYDWPWWRPEAW